jgi:hypothetical protein
VLAANGLEMLCVEIGQVNGRGIGESQWIVSVTPKLLVEDVGMIQGALRLSAWHFKPKFGTPAADPG